MKKTFFTTSRSVKPLLMLTLLFFSFQLISQSQADSWPFTDRQSSKVVSEAKGNDSVLGDKSISPSSCPVTICINTGGHAQEKSQLLTTLADLGFTVLEVASAAGQTCTVAINQPGHHGITDADNAWVSAGNGYVQVGDWGPDFIPNSWTYLGLLVPVAVNIGDPGHPLAYGLPASWSTFGFWHYTGAGGSFISYANNTALPNIASADGMARSLTTTAMGSGTVVNIGWNVYGTDATDQDLQVLKNAILYAAGEDVAACNNACTTLTGDNLGFPIPASSSVGLQTSTTTMGQTGTIGTDWDIESVDLDLTHTFDGDLIIDLVAPDGTTLNLSDGNGLSDNDYISTVFMDGNPNITTGSPPFTGTFEPQGGTFASAFAGVCIVGDWRLNITDQFAGDVGTLNNFEITFCGSAGPSCCVTADEAPMIDTPCPGDIALCGAQNVSWTEPTATDNCDTPTMTRSHAPGDAFAVGTTTVTYTFEDLAGLTVSCSFDVVINPLPVIAINDGNLPAFCQGVKSLSVRVMNEGDLTAPITYAWSHGLGSDEEVVTSENNTTYSVTVTDGNNCSSVATFYLNVDASNLLSAHVLVGDDELEMTNTEVLGGGVGMMDGDEVAIEDNSTIHTFLESEEVSIDGSSTVANHIDAPSTLGLPAFSYNTSNDNNDILVPASGATTLSGSNYGVITVMNNGTLTFDNPAVYVKKLVTKAGATIAFTGSTDVMVKQDVKIGSDNTINAANFEVIMYIGDDFSVSEGSNVILDVFAQEGIEVNEEGSRSTTYMTGLFISNDGVQSGDEVVWNWNLGCSDVTAPAPLMAAINTGEVETATVVTKNLDIYPNPSNGSFTLNTKDYMDKTIDIVIYNTIGEVVWQSHAEVVETSTLAIDLSNGQFANGIYLISVASEGKVETKSLVLNR